MPSAVDRPVAEKTVRVIGIRMRTVSRLAAMSALTFGAAVTGLFGVVAFVASRTGTFTNTGRAFTKVTGLHLQLFSSGAIAVYAFVAVAFVLGTTCACVAIASLVHLFLRFLDGIDIVVTRKAVDHPARQTTPDPT